MRAKLIFRRQNFPLLLAGCINFSLLFAPLAYAANHTEATYAWLHGSWIDLVGGEIHAQIHEKINFYQDGMLGILALVVAGNAVTLLILIFYNNNLQKKRRILLIVFLLSILQILLTLMLAGQLTAYLGTARATDLEWHLAAQFWLLLFPFLFIFRALKGVSRQIEAAASAVDGA